MQRDDDYIRELLFEAEASDQPYLMAVLTMSQSNLDLKRHMHAKWLADSGFFEEINKGVFRVTNQGNDYLASIRDDNIWTKTKDTAASVGGAGLYMMKDIAVAYAKQEIFARFNISI